MTIYGVALPIGGSVGSVGETNLTTGPPPPAADLGPDIFYKNIDWDRNDPATQLNEMPPQAWSEGGVIENVKRAVVAAVRNSLQETTINLGQNDDLKFHVSIEYPTELTQYPGVWVQFTITDLARAGLAMSRAIKDENGNWIEIRQWMFDGRITLTLAALSSKDRDRLADAIIAQLAFSRTTDLTIRDPRIDTHQMKGLWHTLLESPYIAIALGTDHVQSGGQTVTNGVPWAPNVLLYEDSYSIECNGQFNIAFRHDGVYELAAINVNTQPMANEVALEGTWGPYVIKSAQRRIGQSHPPPRGSGGMLI